MDLAGAAGLCGRGVFPLVRPFPGFGPRCPHRRGPERTVVREEENDA